MTPEEFRDPDTRHRHPMDGLREIEDKDKRIAELVDALKVAEDFIDACLKFGIADATRCINFDEYASQALEQIRKVLK